MEGSAKPARTRSRWWIALAVSVGVLGLIALADVATSSPRLCGSCHEMQESAATWSESAHINVACVGCHETPRAWYERPAVYVERGRLLGRDIWRHIEGRLDEPADPRAIGRASPIPDEVCLECHTADRTASSGFRILIDHVEHSERTGSCVACHVYTAHPDAVLGRPLSLMTRCLTCHGTSEHPDASAACETCHPTDFDLRPPTHLEPPWMRDHGFSATAEPRVCQMCHVQRYCDDCHGVEIPHPEDWLGPRSTHAATALTDPVVCERCHTEKPDPCTICHHKGFDIDRGTWLEQHPLEARELGTVSCMECHEPLSCARCHAFPEGVPAP